ncbi:MAG: 30S ribosomal protein S6e [Candidatus Altiarchaeota archaeon]
MEYKVVVSDPKTGKSYQIELKDENAKRIRHRKIGDSIEGALLGLAGYTLEITGGSDKGGFAMKKGLHDQKAQYVLAKEGIGYNPKRDVRVRKRMRGEIISEDVVQVNTKITGYGRKTIEELLGLSGSDASAEGGGSAGEGEASEPKEGDA